MFRSAIVVALLALGLITPSLASAADELSTTNRLQDRREVAAGDRAYSVGFEDGRFYANGWHITGEMGGVWTPPLKLRRRRLVRRRRPVGRPGDEVHQRLGLHPLRPARRRRAAASQRTDFAPDGRRGALFGLQAHQPGRGARP